MKRDPWPNRHTEECTSCGALPDEIHYVDCGGHLGTGIRHHDGARRYLRRKFNDGPAQEPVSRPGHRFYVTAYKGRRGGVSYLLGPYVSHMSALAAVPRARRAFDERCPDLAPFVGFGTVSRPDTVPTVFGR